MRVEIILCWENSALLVWEDGARGILKAVEWVQTSQKKQIETRRVFKMEFFNDDDLVDPGSGDLATDRSFVGDHWNGHSEGKFHKDHQDCPDALFRKRLRAVQAVIYCSREGSAFRSFDLLRRFCAIA